MKRTIKLLTDLGIVENLQKTINVINKRCTLKVNSESVREALQLCVMRVIDDEGKVGEFLDATIQDALDELDLKVDEDYEKTPAEAFLLSLLNGLFK